MSDKTKKIRVISLKEAADINKKNVAYFTLTDGSVAVVKKDGKRFSQNYNTQKDDYSKYDRNYGNNNNYSNTDYNNESYKDKNEIRNSGNYKRRNENSQDSKKGYGEKYAGKYQNEQKSNISPSQKYSYKGQMYDSKNNQEYYKEQNNYGRNYQLQQEQYSSSPPSKGYSNKGQIYDTRKNQEYNREQNNYGRNYQYQKEQNSSKYPNEGYFYKRQMYDTKNNKEYYQEYNKEQNYYNNNIRSKYQNEQKLSSSPSYKRQIYTNSEQNQNSNLDVPQKFQFKRYHNQNNRSNSQEKNKTSTNSNINNNINTNISSKKFHNQIFKTTEISSDKPKSQYKMNNRNQNVNIQSNKQILRNRNNFSKYNKKNSINNKCQIIEAIPVKLCNNYNPQMRNYSHPKPQYVQPYLNPDIIIQEIKLVQINNFGKKSNMDYGCQYNTNYINQYNKQITDSFHDFDNLEDYDQQIDFHNDPFYKNVDLKYSDISVEQNTGLLKNKNRQIKKYERPFTNIEMKNKNNNDVSGSRLIKRQNNLNNNCKFKESGK